MSRSECGPSDIENPQHGHIRRCRTLVSANLGVEPAFSKLWFALGHRILVQYIVFYQIKCLGDHAVRPCQMIGSYEIEVVC